MNSVIEEKDCTHPTRFLWLPKLQVNRNSVKSALGRGLRPIPVVVEGRLQIRDWTDKEGGKRRSAEVIADNVYFGDSKPKEDGAPSTDADFGVPPSDFTPDFGDDEAPF